MARNRKARSWGARFGPALKAVVLCLMIGGAGVGYVWQKNQIYRLGQQLRRLELRRDELQRQNKTQSDNLAALSLPRSLEFQLKRLNLGLVAPEPAQVVRLSDAAPAAGSGPVAGPDAPGRLVSAPR